MYARNPTLMAEMVLFTSQFTVLVAPTAAVAWVPREPTMAVSIYCTAVCISSSSIVGHASTNIWGSICQGRACFDVRIIENLVLFIVGFCCVPDKSPLFFNLVAAKFVNYRLLLKFLVLNYYIMIAPGLQKGTTGGFSIL